MAFSSSSSLNRAVYKSATSDNPTDYPESSDSFPQEADFEFLKTRKEFRAIRKSCLELGIKYEDIDFPAAQSSLLHNTSPPQHQQSRNGKDWNWNDAATAKFLKNIKDVASWQRPENISLTGRRNDTRGDDWVLVKDAHPSDIRQGQLGNCWFIAALTLIAERRELLSKIFISRKFNNAGIYALRLFKDGQWKSVIIDDLLPCDAYNRLVFSSCTRKQLWVPLIEKAMSKLHGSYASLQSGQVSDGLNYLTGFVSERIDLKSEQDHELLWARLLSFHSANFLMGAHITSTDEYQSKNYKENKGLITNHEYSVLQAVCMENNRLIQLRNPWGKFSWKGDWSDNSPLWNEVMSAYLSPHRAEEGIFWMSYRDFIKHFTGMEVCKIRPDWNVYSMDGILPPFADPDCQPCFEIKCEEACEVDISLYQGSKRSVREHIQQTDIGLMVFETNGRSPSTTNFKLVKPVELTLSARHRVISCNLMLAKGNYCLVPFSFGHWTDRENEETFFTFAVTIHASRNLRVSSIRLVNILADALICCSKYFGDRQHFSLGENSEKISVITLNLGYGHCMILENCTDDMIVGLEIDCKTKGDYTSTRSGFLTRDKLAPFHCQVVQIVTPKDTGSSTSSRFSYKIQVANSYKRLNFGSEGSDHHYPPLTQRIEGLHQPRKC